jgi:DNA invertase Pin-like site-specific DNA recombinase
MVFKVQNRRVVYRRVSKDYLQLENQERALNDYTSKNSEHKWEVIEEHVSGRKMTGKFFKELWESVNAGRVVEVVVYSIDRLGRNVKQAITFIDDCIKAGTKIVFLREGFIDVNTPQGRLAWTIFMAFAEYEASLISSRTAEGLKTQAHRCANCNHYDLANKIDRVFKCVKCGSDKAVFWGGVRKGSSWMTAKVKKQVKEILRLYDAGIPRYKIAKLVGFDERTVAKVINNRDNLPEIWECVWDQ